MVLLRVCIGCLAKCLGDVARCIGYGVRDLVLSCFVRNLILMGEKKSVKMVFLGIKR